MRMCEITPAELAGKHFSCACGKEHASTVRRVVTGSGAYLGLPDAVRAFGGKSVFLAADENTHTALGEAAAELLRKNNIKCTVHLLKAEPGFERPEPTEAALGNLVMGSCSGCDVIVGVGGGVVNDLCKLLSRPGNIPYIYMPTCPSMDGYTSDSASVIYNGVKSSVSCKCPDVLLADTDVISKAPKKLLLAGIGDMIAKYVSICEWRISALINGEYYCEEIAEMMRRYRAAAFDNAEKAVQGDPAAVEAIINGLCLVGTAMTYAGCSRPASGVEHYYSHLWDMRCLEEHRQCELHGIQVGVGTLLSLRKYENFRKITPDRKKAERSIRSFDRAAWERDVRGYFGASAGNIIGIEDREGKYDAGKCLDRLGRIIDNWDGITRIIDEELIPSEKLEELFIKIGHPTSPEEFGESEKSAGEAFRHTCDIRDKYILTRLLFDLGISPDEI